MVDHPGTLGVVYLAVAPIVVKPEPEDQDKTRAQVEQEKDIYIEPKHGLRLKALDIEETGDTRIVMDAADPLTE